MAMYCKEGKLEIGKTLTIPAPQNGTTVVILSSPGGNLALDFDPAKVAFSRVSDSLVIEGDGGVVIINLYFAAGQLGLPSFTLPEGNVLAAAEFLPMHTVEPAVADLPPIFSQGSSSSDALVVIPGSGDEVYHDYAGELILGVDRLGKLGTDYWGYKSEYKEWPHSYAVDTSKPGFDFGLETELTDPLFSAKSQNESMEKIIFTVVLPTPAEKDITIKLGLSGTGKFLNQTGVEDFMADISVPNGYTLEFDGTNWFITFTIPKGASRVDLNFVMLDNHISQNTETVVFTILEATGVEKPPLGQSVTLNVIDDTPANWDGLTPQGHWDNGASDRLVHNGKQGLDGPAIGITNTGSQSLPEGGGNFTFQLTMTDPRTQADYTGFKGDGIMSQDVVLVINPAASGTTAFYHDEMFTEVGQATDYYLQPSADLLQLRADGFVDFELNSNGGFLLNADGFIEISVHGRVDANGNLHGADGTKPLALADLSKLTLEGVIFDDVFTELADEKIVLEVVEVKGNESMLGQGANGTIIKDDANGINGPQVLFNVVPNPVSESGPKDSPFAPTDNMGRLIISMSGGFRPNGTADEDVYMTLTLGGGDAVYGSGNPTNDTLLTNPNYYLGGTWTAGTDAQGNACMVGSAIAHGPGGFSETVTLYRYDNAGGAEVKFAMPKGSTSVIVEYTINDDLLENMGTKTFDAKLTLDEKGGVGSGFTYGEATIVGETLASSISPGMTKPVDISEDKRPPVGNPEHLNPQNFDGPFVMVFGNASTVKESNQITTNDPAGLRNTAGYTIKLFDPSGNGTAFTAMQDITVTFTLNLKTASAADIDLASATFGSGNTPVMNLTGPDANGNYTFQVKVPAGSTSIGVKIPIVDDHITESNELFALQITSLKGNEARLWDNAFTGGSRVPPAGAETDGKYAGDAVVTTIVEDVKATYDGPVIGVKQGGNSVVPSVTEGTAVGFTITLGDPTNSSNPYTGYNGGGVLQQDITVTLQVTGTGGGQYGKDFALASSQPQLNLLKASGLISGYTIDATEGTITVILKEGANITTLQPGLVVRVNILNDNYVESGEGFKVAVTSTKGHESTVGTGCTVQNIADDGTGAYVNITKTPSVQEGTDLVFLLTASKNPGGPNIGANGTVPGFQGPFIPQPVTVTLEFTKPAGGANFDPTGNPNTAATTQDFTLNGLVTALQNAGYTNVSVDYTNPAAPRVTLTIAPEQWGAANSGGVELKIPTLNDLYSEGNEGVKVTIVNVSGSETQIGTPTTTGTITDNTSVLIGITGDTLIYEAPTGPASGGTLPQSGDWNAALYTINFTKAASWPANKPYTSVEAITFNVTLGNGTATYDGNTANDGTLPTGLGDFRWQMQDDLIASAIPGADTMTSSPALIAAINTWLTAHGYLPAGVTVTAVVGTNGSVLTFKVDPGVNLSTLNIKLPVLALDDTLSDSGEKYTITISNAQGNESGIDPNKNKVTTEIQDGELTGLTVGLQTTIVCNESETNGINLPLLLFKEDGFTPVLAADMGKVQQDITVVIRFTADIDDPAVALRDYRVNNLQKVGDNWELTVTITPAQWVPLAGGQMGINIVLTPTDNTLTEADKILYLEVISSKGAETSVSSNSSSKVTIRDDSNDPTVMDPNGNYNGTDRFDGLVNVLDGPKFNSFIQKQTSVHEAGYNDTYPDVLYKINFDSVITQLIAISLDVTPIGGAVGQTGGNSANAGADYLLCGEGSNLGAYNSNGSVYYDGVLYADINALWAALPGINGGMAEPPQYIVNVIMFSNYFVFAKVGDSSTNFSVKILPDRITEAGEGFTMEITGMAGNEVIFDPAPDKTKTTTILDNDDGPRVTIASGGDNILSSDDATDTAKYKLNISNLADEDFVVNFSILLGPNTPNLSLDFVEIFGPNGVSLGLATMTTSTSTEIKYTFTMTPKHPSTPMLPGDYTVVLHAAQGTGSHGEQTFYFGITDTDGKGESEGIANYIPGKISGNQGGGPVDTLSITGGGAAPEGNLPADTNGLTYTVSRTGTDNSAPCNVEMVLKLGPDVTYPGDFDFGSGVTVVDNGNGTYTLNVTIPAGQSQVSFNSIFKGDTTPEWDEYFDIYLTGGGLIDLNNASAHSVILDDDATVVNVSLAIDTTHADYGTDPDGNQGFFEGTAGHVNIKIQADPSNTNGVLTDDLVVNLIYNPLHTDLTAEGVDYVPTVYSVTIPAGTPIAAGGTILWPIPNILLPDNAVTDGNRNFTIAIDTATGTNGGTVSAGRETVVILDDAGMPSRDGPDISHVGDTGTVLGTDMNNYVSENNSTVGLSYSVNAIPDQDITMTMQFTGDITRINASTVQYLNPATGVWTNTTLNPDGTFNVVIPKGYDHVTVNFNTQDDALSNGNANMSLSVAKVHGAEAGLAVGFAPFDFIVVDDAVAYNQNGVSFAASPDGPRISLACDKTVINENGAPAVFTLGLTKAPTEDVTVAMQVAPTMLDRIQLYNAAGQPWTSGNQYLQVVLGGVPTFVQVTAGGAFTIVIPTGTTTVTIPVTGIDNSIVEGSAAYAMSITSIVGGEATTTGTTTVNLNIDDPVIRRGLSAMFAANEQENADESALAAAAPVARSARFVPDTPDAPHEQSDKPVEPADTGVIPYQALEDAPLIAANSLPLVFDSGELHFDAVGAGFESALALEASDGALSNQHDAVADRLYAEIALAVINEATNETMQEQNVDAGTPLHHDYTEVTYGTGVGTTDTLNAIALYDMLADDADAPISALLASPDENTDALMGLMGAESGTLPLGDSFDAGSEFTLEDLLAEEASHQAIAPTQASAGSFDTVHYVQDIDLTTNINILNNFL